MTSFELFLFDVGKRVIGSFIATYLIRFVDFIFKRKNNRPDQG